MGERNRRALAERYLPAVLDALVVQHLGVMIEADT
jgi:hypothetical protein